jgi:hypothetical protein
MTNRQHEEIRWTHKRMSRDYSAKAGVSAGSTDEAQREFMHCEYETATLHERINRRAPMPK